MAEICTSEDGVALPWWFDREVVDVWNHLMCTPPLKFRTFQDKRNRFDSRRRISKIIIDNAQYLDGTKRTDRDVLHERFSFVFHSALTYVRSSWDEDADALEVLGARYPITMGIWQFLRPDLSNLVHLDGLKCGEPDALAQLEQDKARRQEKAKIIKAFQSQLDEFIQKCAYTVGSDDDSNKRLRQVFDVACEGLADAEEQLEWTEG